MKKRFWKGLLILLAVLLVLYLAVQGYIAMETKKRADAPGNAAEYDVDQLQAREATALNGKTILFLGSRTARTYSESYINKRKDYGISELFWFTYHCLGGKNRVHSL